MLHTSALIYDRRGGFNKASNCLWAVIVILIALWDFAESRETHEYYFSLATREH